MAIYSIDGVRVPYKNWVSRQIFGEYYGASFTSYRHAAAKQKA